MPDVRLLLSFIALASARHSNTYFGSHYGPTWRPSNSTPTVPMHTGSDSSLLWASRRSPTTQLLVFSPDRFPISSAKMVGYTEPPGFNFTRKVFRLVVKQKACRLPVGMPVAACFASNSSVTDGGTTREFEFFRLGGGGGVSRGSNFKELDILTRLGESLGYDYTEYYLSPFYMFTRPVVQYLFDGATADLWCNNHRNVTPQAAFGDPLPVRMRRTNPRRRATAKTLHCRRVRGLALAHRRPPCRRASRRATTSTTTPSTPRPCSVSRLEPVGGCRRSR
jgi:hypothetical protein